MPEQKKTTYQDSLKSLDTEEGIDLVFYRPIGYAWACLAKKLGIHPNAITIASIFLGIGAGIAFYYNDLLVNIVGMLLLIWANSFDSADGQLARMTKQYSRLGRILDGVSGDIWFFTIYFCICLRENATSPFFTERPWLIWIIAAVAGVFHGKQASMADYYRQFHLYFLKGEEGSELDNSKNLHEKYAAMPWSGNVWAKLTLLFYGKYTANQESSAPAMQRLRATLNEKFDNKIPQTFRDDFRAKSLPLMKYTNILTFNWRCIALFISLFIGQPWLYFAFELLVLNSLLLYMVWCHERMCSQLNKDICNGKY